MSKIGIITFHASHNCGSFLQSYALQRFLIKKGYPNEIINFSNSGQQELYRAIPKITGVKSFIKNIILLPHHEILHRTFNEYESFINQNLILSSKTFHSDSELQKATLPYRTYISGSDQIWNITIADSDSAYFLDFVQNGKKIAYAPSLGAKSISQYASPADYEKYMKLLLNYDVLSIREKNGQKWLQNMLKKDIPIVLDPTLLLNAKDYQDIERPYDDTIKHYGPYIFYYSSNYDPKITSLVKKIAKKYRLKVIAWSPKSFYARGMNFQGFYLQKIQNPGVYLSLIRDSVLTITDSFHGTVFSTIYRKPFWIIKAGGLLGNDDRAKTLLEQLKIMDRLIPLEFDPTFNYMQEPNYSSYERSLVKLQSDSTKFLLEAINDGKQTTEKHPL